MKRYRARGTGGNTTDAEGKEDVFFGFDRWAMVVRHLGLKEGDEEDGFKAML